MDRQGARSRSLLGEPDHTVVVAAPTVNDARVMALGVAEEVEVVPDQFHLLQSLVNGHGRGTVVFLTDYQRPVTFHLDRDDTRRLGGILPGVIRPAARAGQAR